MSRISVGVFAGSMWAVVAVEHVARDASRLRDMERHVVLAETGEGVELGLARDRVVALQDEHHALREADWSVSLTGAGAGLDRLLRDAYRDRLLRRRVRAHREDARTQQHQIGILLSAYADDRLKVAPAIDPEVRKVLARELAAVRVSRGPSGRPKFESDQDVEQFHGLVHATLLAVGYGRGTPRFRDPWGTLHASYEVARSRLGARLDEATGRRR